MQIGGPDSTIRSINASRYPLMRRTWDATNAGCCCCCCCSRLHACTHGLAGEGEGEGPAFSSSEWHLRLLLGLGRRLSANPPPNRVSQSLLLLLPLLSLLLLLLLLISNACVVSWLGGWVAWLCRVGSCCCSRCP